MTRRNKKMIALLLAAVLCLAMAGCSGEEPSTVPTGETQTGKPILPGFTDPGRTPTDYTAVYVSVFEDMAILASYPVLEYDGEEPECAPREISGGGSIRCGGEHEQQTPIKQVVIADNLVPRAMNDWFRNLVYLESIQGVAKVRTHHVTDMSHLFAGCERLAEVNVGGWDVSNVTDMTGIFDDCSALTVLPEWYASGEGDTLE